MGQRLLPVLGIGENPGSHQHRIFVDVCIICIRTKVVSVLGVGITWEIRRILSPVLQTPERSY